MLDALGSSGAKVEAVVVCPHHPDDECSCRKPKPGLLRDAADGLKLDLDLSFMIGDHRTDVEAGASAGCTTILVRTGRSASIQRADPAAWATSPDFIADDLVDAALWVLGQRAVQAAGGRLPAQARAEVNRR